MNANLLTATVTVPGPAPDAVRAPQAHKRYFTDPNHEEWGPWLGRVLFHETIHLWQMLSSRYVADLAGEEWRRVGHFEKTGEVQPASRSIEAFTCCAPGRPFSAFDLFECWARYWDVHTRGAYRIIEEEGIPGPDVPDILAERGPGGFGYTGRQFDLVMKRGDDCEHYARPYLWMLDRARGNTRFVAYAFPIICFHAFRCNEPVDLFLECFETAQNEPSVQAVIALSKGNINVDWFAVAEQIEARILKPALALRGVTGGGIGMGAIIDGALSDHPLLPNYVNWFAKLAEFAAQSVPKLKPPAGPQDFVGQEIVLMIRHVAAKPVWILKFPGQPSAREILGHYLPPMCVRFDDFSLYAGGTTHEHAAAKPAEGVAAMLDRLEERVRRFQNAKFAVENGLPADAFD